MYTGQFANKHSIIYPYPENSYIDTKIINSILQIHKTLYLTLEINNYNGISNSYTNIILGYYN